MLSWHTLLYCILVIWRWFIYLARLSITILFGAALMILEALIFLLGKTKAFMECLFYTMLKATKI